MIINFSIELNLIVLSYFTKGDTLSIKPKTKEPCQDKLVKIGDTFGPVVITHPSGMIEKKLVKLF